MLISEYDRKVESLFSKIMIKLDNRSPSNFQTLKMRSTMYNQRNKDEENQDRNLAKSVFVKRYENEDDSVEKRNSPDSALFRSTFVNIKNARYQLDPIHGRYKVKNLQFPDFGKKKSVTKIKTVLKNPIESLDLMKSQREAKKNNANVKQSWKKSNVMGSIHLKKIDTAGNNGVEPSIGRRVFRRKFDKTEENIEGWKPSPSFMEEDHDHGIIKFM